MLEITQVESIEVHFTHLIWSSVKNSFNPSSAAKMLSAKFLVCYKFQVTSTSFKVGENIVQVSNSLDLGETPSYSSGSKLFAYGTIVVLGGLRDNCISVLYA